MCPKTIHPFLIIHGDQDKLVPYHQSVLLKDALEAVEARVTFYKVEGGGHGWFKDPKVPELTKAFLGKTLETDSTRGSLFSAAVTSRVTLRIVFIRPSLFEPNAVKIRQNKPEQCL